MPTSPSRRQFLLAGGTAILAACSAATDDETSATTPTTGSAAGEIEPTTTTAIAGDGATGLRSADFDALAICTMLPESTAGPFPTIDPLVRRDVTEGYPGHPLRLGLRAVDAACVPIDGATVEIWHTDASGDYSSYRDGGTGKDEAAGSTFCRGTQSAGADGIVEFHTIVPGWYPGRAVHIHARAHVGGETVYTGQLYFDDGYLERVFAEAPYDEFGPPTTTVEQDRIAGNPAADGTLLTTSVDGDGTLALCNLGLSAG